MYVLNALTFYVISVFYGSFRVNGDAGNMWGYQDGIHPAEWPREYRTCGGRRQSPIDIQTSQIVVDERLGRFDLSDLNMINNIRLTLKNNGHTVEVDVEGRNNLAVVGGGLPGSYLVKQFHFHWGSQDSRGSEHDINGRFFPMELDDKENDNT
ncbi:carbonic anhydrase 7-like [Mytilus trossulus]|uniref:carbonic anhydrase 7-like n=1 Tax=Mytilus trossulus TaxID=6551 RepID=UPI0030059E86